VAPEARYLPFEPEGDIPDADQSYVELFDLLAKAVVKTKSAEDLTLLLSTCRNAWMTINAIFVDLRSVVGAAGAYDPMSAIFYRLGQGRVDGVEKDLRATGLALEQVTKKLDVWARRHELFAKLTAAVDELEYRPRSMMRSFLVRQQEAAPTSHIAHGRYLALNLDAEPDDLIVKRELCAWARVEVRRVRPVAWQMITIAEPLSRLSAAQGESVLFAADDLDEVVLRDIRAAWPALIDVVDSARSELGSFAQLDSLDVDVDQMDIAEARRRAGAIADAGRQTIHGVHERLEAAFTPNVSLGAPMPSPFVVDLTGGRTDGRPHGREFNIRRVTGTVVTPDNDVRVALLRCGLPEAAYSQVDASRYVFGHGTLKSQVIATAKAAITTAAERGCRLLAMPEVFVPEVAQLEIGELANTNNLLTIYGGEYASTQSSRPVNPVRISIPGVTEQPTQLKQGPSMFELRAEESASDGVLRLLRDTPAGVVGVIVCSDYLELDVVTQIAAVPERLDMLIICTRNPNIRVFEALAIADAARMYAAVAVVNARPDTQKSGAERLPATGDGTLIALPRRKNPLLEEADRVPLGVEWHGDEPPALAIYDLPIRAIRSRDRRNPVDDTFLPAPTFIRRRELLSG
jgi:hypothetical protein